MIIHKTCSKCRGDGWIAEPQPVEYPWGFEWEEAQMPCESCNGQGYNEIEVDENGMPK